MLPNGVMNAQDVANYLHLGKNTVYQLAKTGQLASYHVGRKLRFSIEDVEAYVASTHRVNPSVAPHPPFSGATQAAARTFPAGKQVASQAGIGGGNGTGALGQQAATPGLAHAGGSLEQAQSISDAAAFGALGGNGFTIAGGDVMADLIASSLNAGGTLTSRLVRGSYTALVNLYAGDADAAIVHLYDQKTNSYNVPYVRSLAPGASTVVFRLYGRKQGLVVAEGNPKRLRTWGSLLREGVRLSNRAKGSGSRVLLDEKLRAMEARSEQIQGYNTHSLLATSAISRVSSGLADVAIGSEREALREPGVEFVPLQDEWVDLVVVKTAQTRPVIREIKRLLALPEFARDLQVLRPCDLSPLGTIVYES